MPREKGRLEVSQDMAYRNLANAIIKASYNDLVSAFMDALSWEHYDCKYYTDVTEARYQHLIRKVRRYKRISKDMIGSKVEQRAVAHARKVNDATINYLVSWFNGESFALLNSIDPSYLLKKAKEDAKKWAETGDEPSSFKENTKR